MAQHITLTSGDTMPSVGFGTWKISTDTTSDAVYAALQAGYRLIDEACDYGNEAAAGDGIARAVADGVVTRKDLFVTSKLWNTYHRREHVRAACLRTLSDLKLDYLDLYLVHFPISLKHVPMETRYPPEWVHDPAAAEPRMEEDLVPMSETWAAMEALVAEGLVRNIGVCNMGAVQIRDILSYAKVAPAVLQVEMHPYLSQERLVRFAKEKGIAVTAFSSFGGSSYVEIGMATVSECVMDEAVVKDIAKTHNVTAAQVLLRWALQRGVAVIPKSTNAGRLAENLALFSFELSSTQMAEVSALNKNKRFNDPGHFTEAAFSTFYPIYE